MLTSMTGFASCTRDSSIATVTVTVRSVNHRHLDVQCKLPQPLLSMEPALRESAAARLTRGRVDLLVSVQSRVPAAVSVTFHETVAMAIRDAVDAARAQALVEGPLTPGDLLRVPQVLSIRERAAEDDATVLGAWQDLVSAAAAQALDDLVAMRATEGAHLHRELDARRLLVADLVEQIAQAADDGRAALEARLLARVAELRAVVSPDEGAIAQEVVKMAARSDITEELVRFRAHVAHWSALVEAPEPCGRKLDFLLQEMNREVNTMGSKADGVTVSRLIIAAKAELERLREQVQNVE